MSSSGLGRLMLRAVSGAHVRIFRASRGRVGGRVRSLPILLLTTTGRVSGAARTTPLGYIRDGEAFVVVGSNGGSDRQPGWWLNLRRDPEARVELGPTRVEVRARRATGEERARLWGELVGRFPLYARYEQATARAIPVVVLDPAAATRS